MKISELEYKLQKHAEITKSVIPSPFNIESEEFNMTQKKLSLRRSVLLVAAIICLVGTTAFAAFRLMSAKEAANMLGDSKLAKYFSENGCVSETVTDGAYRATVLGITSGENLSSFKSSSWEIFSERTYAVVAVEKTDGTEMTFDDDILVSPLIEGLNPYQYNIFTMNGGYTADIIDGILYRIIEFDRIEYFADRNVYIAVLSEAFINNKSYAFNEETGEIAAKKDYDGTNILIKLELDKSKANPKKAQEYLDKLNNSEKTSVDSDEAEYQNDEDTSEEVSVEIPENSRFNVSTDTSSGEAVLVITE